MKRWASSAKKFDDYESSRASVTSYHLYRDDGLSYSRQFRARGPLPSQQSCAPDRDGSAARDDTNWSCGPARSII